MRLPVMAHEIEPELGIKLEEASGRNQSDVVILF